MLLGAVHFDFLSVQPVHWCCWYELVWWDTFHWISFWNFLNERIAKSDFFPTMRFFPILLPYRRRKVKRSLFGFRVPIGIMRVYLSSSNHVPTCIEQWMQQSRWLPFFKKAHMSSFNLPFPWKGMLLLWWDRDTYTRSARLLFLQSLFKFWSLPLT
jgi:hypothetical protein